MCSLHCSRVLPTRGSPKLVHFLIFFFKLEKKKLKNKKLLMEFRDRDALSGVDMMKFPLFYLKMQTERKTLKVKNLFCI